MGSSPFVSTNGICELEICPRDHRLFFPLLARSTALATKYYVTWYFVDSKMEPK